MSERMQLHSESALGEHATLLNRMDDVRMQFSRAFSVSDTPWSEEETDELFRRIAGERKEPSEALQVQLKELFFLSLSSAFIQAEDRAVYRDIFRAFAHEAKDVATIRDELLQRRMIDKDDTYVIQHLLLAIEKISSHEE